MAIFTVHQPPETGTPAEAAERLVFIREGARLTAFLFGPFWVLRHGLWLVLLVYVAVAVGLAAAGEAWRPGPAVAVGVLGSIWFALVAADCRRWTLERRGWRLVGVVEARNRIEAERRFFDRLAAAKGPAPLPPPPASPRPLVIPGDGLPPVVGFPGARA